LSCRYSDSLRVTALLNNARPSGRVSNVWKETRVPIKNCAPHWRRSVLCNPIKLRTYHSIPVTR
jgi:hypothetical protein